MSPRVSLLLILACAGLAACGGEPDVTIYISLDRAHSEPIIEDFKKETGLDVRVAWDSEANKTIGHYSAIVEERDNPKCDVFWNNEIVQTVRLKQAGLLQPYESPSAADIGAKWKDPQGYWTGFAARARVYIINEPKAKERQPDESLWPARTEDMLDPIWGPRGDEELGQMGIAKPITGTTYSHMAVLWAVKGPDWVKHFWRGLQKQNAHVPGGNGQLMQEVKEGNFIFGFTDTDDFRRAASEGKPVRMVYPDQEPGGEVDGCVVIPNSISMIKGCPHPENAKKLIDYILSRQVEERLANGPSAQMPVRSGIEKPDYVKSADDLHTMAIDWEEVARCVEPFRTWFDGFYAE